MPAGSWGRAWCVTLVACLLAMAGLEATARRHGIRPSWSVGAESWCVEAAALGPEDIAILGTSRALSGIEPATLSRRMGRPAHQLAINATSMLPVLEWLAAREEFHGVVVADVTPRLEFREGLDHHAAAERFVRDFRNFDRSPARVLDSGLTRIVQTRLACKSPGFHLLAPYRDRHESGGRLKRMSVDSTRFIRLEFEPGDGKPDEAEVDVYALTPAAGAELDRLVERFAAAVRALRRRGARVVLAHLPVNGRAAESEDRAMPRRRYWDRLVAATGAEAIHFQDSRALAKFTCPDGEHLDASDAVTFTEALASALGAHP